MTDDTTTNELPPLAAIVYPPGCAVDSLLSGLAADFIASGLEVAGVVQESRANVTGQCDTMLLRDTQDGSITGISEYRGAAASGCKLDARGLAAAAARMEAALASSPALLVLNRFGKAEIEGGGLRAVLSAALMRGIPVLTAVREANADGWRDFHQGMAVDLPPTREAVTAWAAGWRGDRDVLRAA